MSSVEYFGNLVCYVMIFGILDLQGEASQVALTWPNPGIFYFIINVVLLIMCSPFYLLIINHETARQEAK